MREKILVFIKGEPGEPVPIKEVSRRYGIKVPTLRTRASRCETRRIYQGKSYPVFTEKELQPARDPRRCRGLKVRKCDDKPKPSIQALDDRVRARVKRG